MAEKLPLPPRWHRNIDAGWVEFPSDADTIRGYFAAPKDDRNAPGIIMVHENLGVIEHRQDVTRRLADLGYAALTVDLFSRAGGQPPQDFTNVEERRSKAFIAARDEQALPDLDAGVAYLASLGTVDTERLGAIGYCLGGGTMLAWLCGHTSRVRAAVAFYPTAIVPAVYRPDGKPLSRVAVAHQLSCPLQVHFGELDRAVPSEDQKQLDEALKGASPPVEFHRHPGANHAYQDDTHQNYHSEAAERSWTQAMRFLSEHLGEPRPGPKRG
jgi:carboxymethylenebutenolidase